jgi:hypothetical protein
MATKSSEGAMRLASGTGRGSSSAAPLNDRAGGSAPVVVQPGGQPVVVLSTLDLAGLLACVGTG